MAKNLMREAKMLLAYFTQVHARTRIDTARKTYEKAMSRLNDTIVDIDRLITRTLAP